MSERNPFHELRLALDASADDVVRAGEERVDLAENPDEARDARRAVQELNTHPRDRARHELLEVPDADYGDGEWERFARRNRRNPVDLTALAASGQPLQVNDFDLRAVLGLLLDDLLAPPDVDVEPAVRAAPAPITLGPPPLEVRDVVFG
jgi:hypothetical protein